MDEITIISKTQKSLQQRLQDIGDVLLIFVVVIFVFYLLLLFRPFSLLTI